jgi:integrase
MATLKYFVNAKKRIQAPIYVRLFYGSKLKRIKGMDPTKEGAGYDLICKSGLMVEPSRWSNNTETIKQRIRTDDDNRLIDKLEKLKKHINSENKEFVGNRTKEWLTDIIDTFHNVKHDEGKTLNGYISYFISEAKEGRKSNKSVENFAPGTIRTMEGFQRIFNEYQGIYTDKRLDKLRDENKALRPLKILQYSDLDKSFGKRFNNFLKDEGYGQNTMGRFTKQLKYFMQNALDDDKHDNRDFETYKVLKVNKPIVALTENEVESIYKLDLRNDRRHELARDAFILLCETCLRVSDYSKDFKIVKEGETYYIHLFQQKTRGEVFIPLTARAVAILKKYDWKPPRLHPNYINKYIKFIASQSKINEIITWPTVEKGLRFDRSAPKWELITCHSGRRTGATLMRKAGMKIDDIMVITGHKTQAQLMEYIGETKKEAGKRVGQHEYFTGSKLKVVG